MKNILLSVIAILMLSMVQGQTEFGLKAGANFASYKYATSDQLVDASPRTSFYIGGYLNTPMTQRIDLHPEISLQGKGAKLKESSNWGNAKVTQRVMWLDFTANVLVKIPAKNVGHFFTGAGPYVGFPINGENNYAGGNTTAAIIYKDNALKSVDYGVNFLGGIKFLRKLSFHISYRLGFANIANTNYKWSDSVKNKVLSIGLGIGL